MMIVRTGNAPDRHVDVGPAYGHVPGHRGGVAITLGIPPDRKALEGIHHSHGDMAVGPRGAQQAWKDGRSR